MRREGERFDCRFTRGEGQVTIATDVYREQWLVHRLSQFGDGGPDITGFTTPDERKQRVRQYIEKHCGPTVVLGRKKDGRPLLSGEAYKLTFGEEL